MSDPTPIHAALRAMSCAADRRASSRPAPAAAAARRAPSSTNEKGRLRFAIVQAIASAPWRSPVPASAVP
jgi:hypothetical protein